MFILLMTLLGAAMGSFLTVAVARFERGESFGGTSRSYCEGCKKQLRWWELLPVVSYLFLRGRCARCQSGIPVHMFVFEVITAAVFLLFAATYPNAEHDPRFYGQLIIISSLLLLFFYDWRHQVFPALYIAISAGLVVLFLVLHAVWWPGEIVVVHQAIGAVVGTAVLGALAFPSKGQWMGYGDVLLVAILGLWVGYPLIIVTLLLAFYLGAIMGIGMIVLKKVNKQHRIAFGPFLIIGAIITQIWGEPLFRAIMRLWGG